MFRRSLRALVSFALVPLCAGSVSATTYYVDGLSGGNGLSWATAFTTLDPALAAAVSGDQIWVSVNGPYYPSVQSIPGVPRTETFAIPFGVQVYGGFIGTETAPKQRDPANRSILSGNIGGIGNAFHVVTVTGNCTLDAFVITGGNANGAAPFDAGGGLYVSRAPGQPMTAEFVDVTVGNNSAIRGGGVFATDGKLTMLRCHISENSASTVGGGMYFDHVSVRADNCTVEMNTAQNDGGGLFATGIAPDGSGRPEVQFCNGLFDLNTAQTGFGGGIFLDGSSAVSGKCVLTYCTLSDNAASVRGGGIYSQTLSAVKALGVIENSIVWNNTLQPGGLVDELGGRIAALYSDCPLTTALGCFYTNPQFLSPGYDIPVGSPCANSGNAAFGPADLFDLDGDGNLFEPIPVDITAVPPAAGRKRPLGSAVSSGAFES